MSERPRTVDYATPQPRDNSALNKLLLRLANLGLLFVALLAATTLTIYGLPKDTFYFGHHPQHFFFFEPQLNLVVGTNQQVHTRLPAIWIVLITYGALAYALERWRKWRRKGRE